MPFCTNCGTALDAGTAYCPECGVAQPGTRRSSFQQSASPGFGASPQGVDFLHGISDRTASILCYIPVFGVIPAIIFLASQRFRTNVAVRFDGFQSLYLFVAWLIVSSAVPTLLFNGIPGFGVERSLLSLLKLGIFVCWIFLLIKAAQEQQVRLPIIGDLAARSTTEQL